MSRKIEYKEIKRIYGAAKGAGIDNEMLHSIVYQETGKDSIKKLSDSEAYRIIDRLNGRNKTGSGMITNGQLKTVKKLMLELKALGGDFKDVPLDKRLQGILKKHFNRDEVRWLTRSEGVTLIEIIKKIIRTEKRKNENIKDTKSENNKASYSS